MHYVCVHTCSVCMCVFKFAVCVCVCVFAVCGCVFVFVCSVCLQFVCTVCVVLFFCCCCFFWGEGEGVVTVQNVKYTKHERRLHTPFPNVCLQQSAPSPSWSK